MTKCDHSMPNRRIAADGREYCCCCGRYMTLSKSERKVLTLQADIERLQAEKEGLWKALRDLVECAKKYCDGELTHYLFEDVINEGSKALSATGEGK